MAEAYVESIVELLKNLGARRFGFLGSTYDMVPYTRPLMVTGSGSSEELQNLLSSSGVISNDLEGPTTILGLVGQQMLQLQAEVFDVAVHLPGYQTPQEDYRGEKRILEIVESIYGVAVPLEVVSRAREQEDQLKQTAEAFLLQQPQLKMLLTQLEDRYDARINSVKQVAPLSPEIENFLKDLNLRFDQG
jgi:predicted ATP-grasp superfamily ATP-dependent carboligase